MAVDGVGQDDGVAVLVRCRDRGAGGLGACGVGACGGGGDDGAGFDGDGRERGCGCVGAACAVGGDKHDAGDG